MNNDDDNNKKEKKKKTKSGFWGFIEIFGEVLEVLVSILTFFD